MAERKEQILEYLRRSGVGVRELSKSQLVELRMRWLRSFAGVVKKQQGEWVYRGFKWHAFSYNFYPSKNGKAATADFQKTKGQFYIFDEEETFGFLNKPTRLFRPDLSTFRTDLYVTAYDFSWTMVFTHEQPEIGPFFAISRKSPSTDA